MSQLHGDFGTGGFDGVERLLNNYEPEAWRVVLNSPEAADAWRREPNAMFIYDVDDRRYWLAIEMDGFRFALRYLVDEGGNQTLSLVSVGDETQLANFITFDNQSVASVGSFVPQSDANQAIVDFLASPTTPPPLIKWIDVEALNWPDPYG